MRVRLIVPRRADRGHRDKVWDFCRTYWQRERPDWLLVEGEHTEGRFNRSAAINRAAEGEWDVAVILDADTIVDIEPVERAIEAARTTGHLVLPFSTRNLLSRTGTRKIIEGRHNGSWGRFVTARQTSADAYEYVSGCQVVPRALWEAVNGFDERFESYGGEDDAFHAATIALSGHDAREDRLDGVAWHLWHAHSPDAGDQAARKLVRALAERYTDCAWDRERMLALLSEPRTPDQIVVSVLTCPGRDTLAPTIASLDEKLVGPIGRKIICVDAEEADFDPFPGWETIPMGRAEGYVKATRSCQLLEIGSGQPWVCHVEDDVELNETVVLGAMQSIMEAHSELAQLSLKRNPWWDEEVAVGDMLTWRPPETFTHGEGYVAHRAFWTTTFSLVRRSFLAANEWPTSPGSEKRFGRRLFRNPDVYSAMLGKLEDPPRMTHIGHTRAGFGY